MVTKQRMMRLTDEIWSALERIAIERRLISRGWPSPAKAVAVLAQEEVRRIDAKALDKTTETE